MRDSIFISYRRADAAGHAGRLYDRLSAQFGADHVFMDVDAIEPGENFVKALADAEQRCAALVVVIGREWLTPRLQNTGDFVRREVEAGLGAGARVLPVLVQGATMPDMKQLPDSLAALALRQALSVRDDHFQRDVDELIAALREAVRSTAPSFAGTWKAQVKYDWGAVHDETFRFEMDDDELLGTASYTGIARAIQNAQVSGNKITFVTESLTALGDHTYREKHAYTGKLEDGEIRFRLQTDSGYDTRLPETFVARRA